MGEEAFLSPMVQSLSAHELGALTVRSAPEPVGGRRRSHLAHRSRANLGSHLTIPTMSLWEKPSRSLRMSARETRGST